MLQLQVTGKKNLSEFEKSVICNGFRDRKGGVNPTAGDQFHLVPHICLFGRMGVEQIL